MGIQKKKAPLPRIHVEIQENLHCLRWRRLSLAGSSENKPRPALIAFVPGRRAVVASRPARLGLDVALCFMLELWAEMLIADENLKSYKTTFSQKWW